MTPTVLFALAVAAALLIVFYIVRRISSAHAGRAFDLGEVSTRWLSELRRDEPWTRS
jgi:hypothetical protein